MAEQIRGVTLKVAGEVYRDEELRAQIEKDSLPMARSYAERMSAPGTEYGEPKIVGWVFSKWVPYDEPVEDAEGTFEPATAEDATMCLLAIEVVCTGPGWGAGPYEEAPR